MDEQALQNDPQLQAFLQQQSVQARVMAATMDLTEMCWDKCVDKIGSKQISDSGDSRTAGCLANCVGRFIDASSTMLKHMQNKSGEPRGEVVGEGGEERGERKEERGEKDKEERGRRLMLKEEGRRTSAGRTEDERGVRVRWRDAGRLAAERSERERTRENAKKSLVFPFLSPFVVFLSCPVRRPASERRVLHCPCRHCSTKGKAGRVNKAENDGNVVKVNAMACPVLCAFSSLALSSLFGSSVRLACELDASHVPLSGKGARSRRHSAKTKEKERRQRWRQAPVAFPFSRRLFSPPAC